METSGSCSSGSAPDERALRALTVDAPLANAPRAEGSAHTPAPWVADTDTRKLDGRTGVYRAILDSGAGFGSNIVGFVCVAHALNHDLERHGEANARLIAAAPDLLEALIELLDSVEGMADTFKAPQRKARAAIARATGEAA